MNCTYLKNLETPQFQISKLLLLNVMPTYPVFSFEKLLMEELRGALTSEDLKSNIIESQFFSYFK